MKTRQSLSIIAASILWASVAHAQSVLQPTLGPQLQPQVGGVVSSAQQSAESRANSFGTLNFEASPGDTRATIKNVSAPILGSYAPAMSPFGCAPTTQGGLAFAGFSIGGGGAVDKKSCVLFTGASEMVRQAFNTPKITDEEMKVRMQAADNMHCQISAEIYHAMIDAGLKCSRKPDDLPREETQPESTRVAGN